MTTPDEDPTGERRRPDVGRQDRAVAAAPTGPATSMGPATTPGLVVTEDRLADGRHITYFEVATPGPAATGLPR